MQPLVFTTCKSCGHTEPQSFNLTVTCKCKELPIEAYLMSSTMCHSCIEKTVCKTCHTHYKLIDEHPERRY